MLDWLQELFDAFASKIMEVLPLDPFQQFLSQVDYSKLNQYLGYVAYFIPIHFLVLCLSAFLSALGLYYFASIVLRWIRAIS